MHKIVDTEHMQLALQQARLAASKGEVPVGAVVVREERVVWSGERARPALCLPWHDETFEDQCADIEEQAHRAGRCDVGPRLGRSAEFHGRAHA